MGGIKNKLNNNNKAKNLFNALSLKERADERSSSGEVNSKEVKGSRLPSFSRSSKMPGGQISNNSKLSHLSLSFLTDGSLRPASIPVLQYTHGSVAQWIEQLRPKEKVVRSTRIWATRYYLC